MVRCDGPMPLSLGELDTGLKWQGPWTDFDSAVDLLLGRQLAGKAVLDIRR